MSLTDKILARHRAVKSARAGTRWMGGHVEADRLCDHCHRPWPCQDAQDALAEMLPGMTRGERRALVIAALGLTICALSLWMGALLNQDLRESM